MTPTHTLHVKYLFGIARQCVDEAEGLFLANTHPSMLNMAPFLSQNAPDPRRTAHIATALAPSAPLAASVLGRRALAEAAAMLSLGSSLRSTASGANTPRSSWGHAPLPRMLTALDDEPLPSMPSTPSASRGIDAATPSRPRSASRSAAPPLHMSGLVVSAPPPPPPWAWLHLLNWLADERPLCSEFALSEHQLDSLCREQQGPLDDLRHQWQWLKTTVPSDDLGTAHCKHGSVVSVQLFCSFRVLLSCLFFPCSVCSICCLSPVPLRSFD
jgi:hypothetical protein